MGRIYGGGEAQAYKAIRKNTNVEVLTEKTGSLKDTHT